MKFLLFAITFLFACEISFASRILFLFPIQSKSHLIIVQSLSTTLAEKGHEVTVVSPFPLSKPMKNYRDIKIPLSEESNFINGMVMNSNQSMLWSMTLAVRIVTDLGESMLEMPEFKKMIREESFDLVIIGLFMNNFLLGIGEKLNCPTMMLSVNPGFAGTSVLFGNPLGVSAVPHMALPENGRLNFISRLKNFLLYGADYTFKMYTDRVQSEIYYKHFPSDRYRSYDEAEKNLSMVLVNGHFSQGAVRPNVPAIVDVGGLQIKPKPDPLPTNLQEWLDGAADGAIFFSFGSNAKTSSLPDGMVTTLLTVFSKLKQRVIMKWDSETLENMPENVMIGKWLPQDDILAHKNIKLFISHCGLGGTVESKYHGVPIVAIPIFGDQEGNAETIVNEGWAVKVDFATLNEKSLSDGITKVLSDSKYSETVQRISKLFRDRPMNARETAVYWVEYVIRHRGAPHLQYPGVHLNFWQTNSLDVIAFLTAALYLVYKLVVFFGKFILSKLCKSRPNDLKNYKKLN